MIEERVTPADILNRIDDAMADECKVDRVLDGVSISGSSNPSLERALEKGHFTHILVRLSMIKSFLHYYGHNALA